MPQAPLAAHKKAAVLAALAGGATIAEAAALGRCSTASVDRIKRAQKGGNAARPYLAAVPPPPPSRRQLSGPPAADDGGDVAEELPELEPLAFTAWCLAAGLLVVDASSDVLADPDHYPDAPDPEVWDVLEAGSEPGEVARFVRGACVTQADAVRVLEEALAIVRGPEA